MEKKLITEAERLLNSRHHNKRRTRVIRGVALLVVIATVSALIMPAVTMSNEVECGQEEHIHTQSCYAVRQVAPEPVLTCAAGASGETVIHTHDGYCYDSQGNLICGLPEVEAHVHGPECVQEQRTLLCEEVADPGHQHGASCYSYVRVEDAGIESAEGSLGEYICGMQEGGGAHRHEEECYPEERAEEPQCGLPEGDILDEAGNVVQGGHVHTDGCWMVRVHEKLVCGQEETEDEYDEQGVLVRQGHRHDGSCRVTGDELCARYGCGRHETAGHTHTEECTAQADVQTDAQGERWEKTLVCQEEEREPGHVHTDGCYEIAQVLTCRRQELQAHTHDASCCDENGALICGKAETLVHQHDGACFTVPEGGPEEAEVLICGQEEHTHTDLCYVKARPETEKYYCGMEEHIHNQDCRFSSGELKCTIPEHIHIDDCLTPPSEETVEVEEVSVEVDETIPYESELFDMTIRITGTAVVRSYTTVMELTEPDVPMAQQPFVGGFLSFLFGPFWETADAADIEEIDEPEPEAAAPDSGYGEDGGEESCSPEPDALLELDGEAAQPDIEFTVNELDLNSEEVRTAVELAQENGQMVFTALSVTGCSAGDSSEVDLSGCVIVGWITLKEQTVEALAGMDSVSLADENWFDSADTEVVGEESHAEVAIITTDAETGQTLSRELVGTKQDSMEPESAAIAVAMTDGPVLFSARTGVFPNFEVGYYAMLDRPDTTVGRGLPFLDTSKDSNGGVIKMPNNNKAGAGTTYNTVKDLLTLKEDNTIASKKEEWKIYEDVRQQFDTSTPPKLEELNQVVAPTVGSVHYELLRIEVTYPEGSEAADRSLPGESETVADLAEYFKGVSFTNIAPSSGSDGQAIFIEEGTKLKMVYSVTTQNDVEYDAAFFDYDITNGQNENGTYQTGASGINSEKNYSGTGTKLGFGNGNTRSQWEEEKWNGDFINQGNREWVINGTSRTEAKDENEQPKRTYRLCHFGLVEKDAPYDENGALKFADGIDVPDLFAEKVGNVTGRYDYPNQSLRFIRSGDTYTLSGVGGTSLQNLEQLGTDNSNNFWPMDKIAENSKGQKDPLFGAELNEVTFSGAVKVPGGNTTEGNPKNDDGKKHNPYFGMKFNVGFQIPKGYVGPLEYYFYGDDDMWVILTDMTEKTSKVVCDIGGVHLSAGEYVNLWDYIDKGKGGDYKLTFYYTERGASGSTCWMQFTIPNVINLPTYTVVEQPTPDKSLVIQKDVVSESGSDLERAYQFELTLTNSDQNQYEVKKFNADGMEITHELGGEPLQGGVPYRFTLKDGQKIQVGGLPPGTHYTLKEVDAAPECTVSYAVDGKTVNTTDQSISGFLQGTQGISLVCTNTFQRYQLPETGGETRAQWYTMACVPLLAAGCLWYKKRSGGEGAED